MARAPRHPQQVQRRHHSLSLSPTCDLKDDDYPALNTTLIWCKQDMSIRPSVIRQNNTDEIHRRRRSSVAQLSDPSALQTAYTHVPAALSTTAAVLKEIGEMGAKVPMVKGPAGILVRILEIYDQVLVNREQQEEVEKTLELVGWLMLDTANYCQLNGFSTMAELPADLETAMSSIVRVLHEVNRTLREYEGQTKLQKTIARTNISGKLVSCHRSIQAILEASNLSLTFTTLANDASDSKMSKKVSLGIDAVPSEPQVFLGRDAELSAVVSDIMSGSPPARVAILGPGGIGKTTLALAALHHSQVKKRFKGAIAFVHCDTCPSLATLLAATAQTLKLGLDNTIALQQAIVAQLAELKHCIICFDNFETPWEGDKEAVEIFVGLLSALPSVTLLVTMRGAEEPAYIGWTVVSVLESMDAQAAQKIFSQLCGHWDDWSAKLVDAVDCLPLAVTLLGNLAQTTSTKDLWAQWELHSIASIERVKGHRLTSLEVSIYMSINSVRILNEPSTLQLLSIMCLLPRGLNINRLPEFSDYLSMPKIKETIQTLKQCSLVYYSCDNFLYMHALIRHYCSKYHPICNADKDALKEYYVELITKDNRGKSDLHNEQLIESANICEVLSLVLQNDISPIEHKVIRASLAFSQLLGKQGLYSGTLLQLLEKRLDPLLPDMQIRFLMTWGNCLRNIDDFEACMEKYTSALSLAQVWENKMMEGQVYGFIGEVYYLRNQTVQARKVYMKALKLHMTTNDLKQQIHVLIALSQIYCQDEDWCKAKQYTLRSIRLQQQLDEPSLTEAHCWQSLGFILTSQKHFTDAEASYTKSITLYRQENSILGVAQSIHGIGCIWFDQGEYSTAKRYLQQAVTLIAEKTGYDDCLASLLSQLAYCFHIEHDYKRAFQLYRKCLSLHTARKSPFGLRSILTKMSRLYEAQNLTDNAIFCSIKVCQLHDDLKDMRVVGRNDYDVLARLYTEQSKYELAIDALLKSI
ncbi:TPR-like protein, partial [Auriscalpium vulgare]